MKNKSINAFKIIQILSIIALIIAFLLSGMYFLITTSVNKALANQTAPNLFGYFYVPIANEKLSSIGIGSIGELLVFEEIENEKLTVGSTVLFKNPEVIESNLSLAAYQNYSVGVISKEDTLENSPVFHVTNSDDNPVIVSEQLILAKGSYVISILGSVIIGILSKLGIFYFVLIPGLIFVVFQLTAIIIKITGPKPEELFTKEDGKDEDDEDDEIEVIPYPLGSLGKFTQKNVLLDESLISDSSSLENTIKSETISTLNTDFMSKSALTKSNSSTYDTLEKLDLSKNPIPTFSAKDLPNKNIANQSFLNSTIEFDLNEVKEQLLEESLIEKTIASETPTTPVVNDEIFSLDNSISMSLKENSLDFDFKNILSDKISIEQIDDGDGFSIVTPNYTANIKIEISK